MVEFPSSIIIAIIALIISFVLWFLIKRIEKLNEDNMALYRKIGEKEREKEDAVKNARKDSIKRQRAILKGDISETIAPWSMTIVNSVKELNFLGNPIDFIGFKGLDGNEEIKIIFIEVKSGKSQLNKNQRRIRDAVIAKRIDWVEVRVNDIEIDERIIPH